jgi:hypothetical protein
MRWHIDPPLLDRYLAGHLDPAGSASIEAHVVACEECRAAIAGQLRDPVLDAAWNTVADRVDTASQPWLVRALRRLGVDDATARLVRATPAFTLSFILATLLSVFLAVAAAMAVGRPSSASLFSVIAPVLPLVAVASGYSSRLDPAQEVVRATPYSQYRLVALRTVVVLVPCLVAGTLLGLALPGPWYQAITWLLPGLALSALAFALLGRISAVVTATVLGLTWTYIAVVWARVADDGLAPFRPAAQVLYLLVALGGVALAVSNKERFDVAGRPL